MSARPQVLEMRHVTKSFPGIVANDDVSFDLREGEVHALLGENGAGKSTLMNILYGLYHPDEGEILIKGSPVRLGAPSAAIEAGVGMVHQHFMLIPVMTVAENIVLAEEPTRDGILLDIAEAERRVQEISDRYGLAVDPGARIQDITVGQQQRVEILKALYRDADILVLDEPTAVLTPQEAQELFEVVRQLTARGKSIIFISHKLNEVLEIADRITVLRRGKLIETLPAQGATEESLARLMVGREVLLRVAKTPAQPSETLLEISDLSVYDDRGIEKVRGVTFGVRAGEIVGLAGIDGNGQTELIDAMTGLMRGLRRDGERRRRRRDARVAARPPRGRDRPHPGGPSAPRARARVLDRREHRPPRLPLGARVALRLALPAPADRARAEADPGLRRPRRRPQRPARAASPAATSRRSCSPARSSATRRC